MHGSPSVNRNRENAENMREQLTQDAHRHLVTQVRVVRADISIIVSVIPSRWGPGV